MTPSHPPAGIPLVIGLTGGIGSGKSTVAGLFSALGVPVIDTDLLARELVAAGMPALDEITRHFGPALLHADGSLDRAAMRRLIFSNNEAKQTLESILHPRIRSEIRRRLATVTAPYCIVVIPLLVETGQGDLADRILVVDVDEKEQVKRVAARDTLSDNAVIRIMQTQSARSTRLAAADDVIQNDAGMDALKYRVQELHRQYMELADER